MVLIKGYEKMSLVDYPGVVAATVFLGGCDFKCGFCHNPDLINNLSNLPDIKEDEFFNFLVSRKGWIDGVCVTGGEPCLTKDLPEFIKKIKALGFKVKLDTNGSMPRVLESVVKLVDYIAMDIKASPERYSEASGVKVNMTNIQESINIIRSSGTPYEFRTTIMPKLHSRDDLLKIGEWLEGSKKYYLQQFRPDFGVLDKSYEKETSYNKEQIEEFNEMLKPYFEKTEVRI